MARIKMHIPKAKLPFYPPYEVKYRLQNGVSTYMYLAVSDHAVSAVLLRYQDRIQRLVCYISKMLVDAKTQYLPLEKMALALVHATRKLPHYF